MRTQPEFIESTAGQVAAELAQRGIPPEQRVMVVALESLLISINILLMGLLPLQAQ